MLPRFAPPPTIRQLADNRHLKAPLARTLRGFLPFEDGTARSRATRLDHRFIGKRPVAHHARDSGNPDVVARNSPYLAPWLPPQPCALATQRPTRRNGSVALCLPLPSVVGQAPEKGFVRPHGTPFQCAQEHPSLKSLQPLARPSKSHPVRTVGHRPSCLGVPPFFSPPSSSCAAPNETPTPCRPQAHTPKALTHQASKGQTANQLLRDEHDRATQTGEWERGCETRTPVERRI